MMNKSMEHMCDKLTKIAYDQHIHSDKLHNTNLKPTRISYHSTKIAQSLEFLKWENNKQNLFEKTKLSISISISIY